MEGTNPGLYGINVLVVEDHADTADMLAEALRFCDAYVVTANSARSALHTFDTMAACDVVVTDLSMPDDDGVWLLQQIRASDRPQTRVIAVTGHAVDETRGMEEEARFDAVVRKPFDPFDVCRMVLEVLGPERDGTLYRALPYPSSVLVHVPEESHRTERRMQPRPASLVALPRNVA